MALDALNIYIMFMLALRYLYVENVGNDYLIKLS